MTANEAAITQLLDQPAEPALVYKLHLIQGDDPASARMRGLQAQIRTSARAQRLLAGRDGDGRIPGHPYHKWDGAHWTLAQLADLGYPAGDESLIPLREQVFNWLLGRTHQRRIQAIDGRVRRCASQEGNALWYLLKLGLVGDPDARERVDNLAGRLARWQWPDGGWNCDKRPEAVHSSYHESLIPLRGLALHAQLTGNSGSRLASRRAAEIFLKRHLFRRASDGSVIHDDFLRLGYPTYWHYDALSGLKILAEAGFIDDPRCGEALDWLEAKQLPGGGWPAEKRYYRMTNKQVSGRSAVDWGGVKKARPNPWVTAEALIVLSAAGRIRRLVE